jgi:hypothetical protein
MVAEADRLIGELESQVVPHIAGVAGGAVVSKG